MAKDKTKQGQLAGGAQPLQASHVQAAQARERQAHRPVQPGAVAIGGLAGEPMGSGTGEPLPLGHPADGAAAPAPRRGRTVAIVLACVIVALLVWFAVWFFACNGAALLDPNAQDGQAPYKTAEEMQAELDRVVEEGMFNISIAGAIQFDEGTGDGLAYIENVPGNHYLMKVRITDDATGDVLYESGVLKPNQFIEKITLTHDLDAGTYPATATFTALDQTTYDEVGQAAAKVTINVLG